MAPSMVSVEVVILSSVCGLCLTFSLVHSHAWRHFHFFDHVLKCIFHHRSLNKLSWTSFHLGLTTLNRKRNGSLSTNEGTSPPHNLTVLKTSELAVFVFWVTTQLLRNCLRNTNASMFVAKPVPTPTATKPNPNLTTGEPEPELSVLGWVGFLSLAFISATSSVFHLCSDSFRC